MKAAIVVPWRGGHPVREANWDFCRPWWERFGYPLHVVEHAGPEPFNRAWCINEGARRAGDWDVLVMIDADTLEDTDEQVLHLILQTWETGRFGVGHVAGKDLTQEGTRRLLAGESFDWNRHVAATRAVCDSRVNAVRRDLFDELGGYDERFEGWGHEDVAFTAAATMLRGEFVRVPGNSWHLWHEPQLPLARPTPQWKAGKELANRYLAANDRTELQAILDERPSAAPLVHVGVAAVPPPQPVEPEVELVVITTGRFDYLERTLASADQHLQGTITRRTMIDDSGDPAVARGLDALCADRFEIVHHPRNLGFSRMMRQTRRMIRDTPGPPYVFWLEEDFTFDRDVDLAELATLLQKPGLAQAVLLRGPYYRREHEAGGIIAEHPESYTDEVFEGIQHQAHQRFWSSNPHLATRESFRYAWPTGEHTESRFGRTLWDQGMHVAFVGDGTPWVQHIGAERRGGRGY